MTDQRHRTHSPAAWGETPSRRNDPRLTLVGCGAMLLGLLLLGPLFGFDGPSSCMRPSRSREATRLKRFEDLQLGMPLENFQRLRTAPASPLWLHQSATFNGSPVDRFTLTYPSPYADWETCELIFDQGPNPNARWSAVPTTPRPSARLISIRLDHHRKLTPQEVAREVASLEQRFQSRHTSLKDGNTVWPAASVWDRFEDTKIENRVWYSYRTQDSPHPEYVTGSTLTIELLQNYSSD